jgi:hypothetical protein
MTSSPQGGYSRSIKNAIYVRSDLLALFHLGSRRFLDY